MNIHLLLLVSRLSSMEKNYATVLFYIKKTACLFIDRARAWLLCACNKSAGASALSGELTNKRARFMLLGTEFEK
jgi:hypothetical protein